MVKKIPRSKQVALPEKAKKIIQMALDCQTEEKRYHTRMLRLMDELQKYLEVPVLWSIKMKNGRVVVDKVYDDTKLTSEEKERLIEDAKTIGRQMTLLIQKEINQEFDKNKGKLI